MTLATRVAVMDNGHIRQFADPATIYEDPADLFVASFMGSPPMNMIPGRPVSDGGLRSRGARFYRKGQTKGRVPAWHLLSF